jgi:hypothetical protein
MTHPTIPAPEHRRADELKPGDWVVALLDSNSTSPDRRNAEVLAAFPYDDGMRSPKVLLVVKDADVSSPETARLFADDTVRLLTADELAAIREQAKRSQKVADIRAFADWLEANPAVPAPWQVEADEHLSTGDGTEAERLAKVRQVAAMLGVEADERLSDRTEVEFKPSDFVKYRLIAWHRGGRPVEAVEGERCGTCGESLREIERGTLGHIPGEACAPVDETRSPLVHLGLRGRSRCGMSAEEIAATVHGDSTTISPVEVTCQDCRESANLAPVEEIEKALAASKALDETPAPAWDAPASGLTVEADLSRGPLAGTTPVVAYFSFGHGQTDPDSGQKLIDHYVTVVAPTYEGCRAAMFASRFGRAWSFDYLAGRAKTTEWVSQWTEHEVIVAEGLDSTVAEAALKAAAALLASEPVGDGAEKPCYHSWRLVDDLYECSLLCGETKPIDADA